MSTVLCEIIALLVMEFTASLEVKIATDVKDIDDVVEMPIKIERVSYYNVKYCCN